jgi:HEPN domain-containing protein
MKPEQKKEAERWMRQAEEDLDVANLLAKNRRYNVACFMAQQAAEKAL